MLRSVVGLVLVLAVVVPVLGATNEEHVKGYAEWRRGDILIVEGQLVRAHPGTQFKGDRIRGLDSIALGYEVEAKGERDKSGVIVAREIKAKPNGNAMFESDVLDATNEIERVWVDQGRMFEPGEDGSERTIGRIIESGPQADRVRAIVHRLAPPYLDAERQPRVYLVDTEEWNAAAMGNGAIWVYTGLIESMSDDELAIVLGHELAHYTHEHSRRQAKSSMWRGLLGLGALIAAQALDDDTARTVATVAAGLGLTVWGSGYSRDLEDQADRVGLRYAHEGGFDVGAGTRLWGKFRDRYGESDSVTNFFVGSHSRPSDRIRNIERELDRNYPARTPWSFEPTSELEASLAAATAANVAHDIDREHRILERAEALPGPATLAAAVQRQLALLDWRYYARIQPGRERLHRATSGPDPAEAWLALSRLELATHNHAAARVAADRALLAADTRALLARAQFALAQAVVDQAARARRAGELGQSNALRAALDALLAMVNAEPGSLPPSRWLLRAALLLDRGDVALRAWRSYYHVIAGRPLPNAIAAAGERLENLLPRLGSPAADATLQRDLMGALAGCRFFEEAALMAFDPRAETGLRDDSQARQIIVYDQALRDLRARVEEYYRRTILGAGDPASLTESVRTLGLTVWAAVYGHSDAPESDETERSNSGEAEASAESEAPGSDEALWALLRERFGTSVRLARTPGSGYDLHMGHVIEAQTRIVQQYGRTVELRLVILDSMVSQGFTDWAWEGRTGTRGYSSPTMIYQVRPAFVVEALQGWRSVGNPRTRSQLERRMQHESTLDEQRARANPYGYLPGLAMRLRHQGYVQILEGLELEALSGDNLRAAFLAQYQDDVRESSIVAHEGRHAMDLRDRVRYPREFAAKLSEVAFAPRPRLSMLAIMSSTIGTSSPHGRANLAIMQGLVAWMDEHRDQIAGLDPQRPLLPQFDRLTDEQIRAAFRSMDPALLPGAPAVQ